MRIMRGKLLNYEKTNQVLMMYVYLQWGGHLCLKGVNLPYPYPLWSELSLNRAAWNVRIQSAFWCEVDSFCQPKSRGESVWFQRWQMDKLKDGQTDRQAGGAWQPVNHPGQTSLALQMHRCVLVLIWTPASCDLMCQSSQSEAVH